jgi:hypothetical protein
VRFGLCGDEEGLTLWREEAVVLRESRAVSGDPMTRTEEHLSPSSKAIARNGVPLFADIEHIRYAFYF